MLLVELSRASEAVAATPARNEKTRLLTELIVRLAPGETVSAIGFLIGKPRQGRIGVGWAAVSRLDVPPASTPSITIVELDQQLDALAAATGPGSVAHRDQLLTSLMTRATEAEHTLIRQILTGELRQGALAGVVTAAVAKAAGVKLSLLRRAVMLIGDLGKAAAIALHQGVDALESVQLEVGRPIEPMLASTSERVEDALGALGTASIEWKLDGARIQIHRHGDNISIYTRNLNEVTNRLPSVVAIARKLPVESIVLDGEVLGLVDDGSPKPFQDTMSTFGADASPSSIEMTPFFFDVMHLDGVATIDLPLSERSRLLDRVAGKHRIPAVVTSDPKIAAAHAEAALQAGHEGVMVKGVDGAYEAGRRGKSWRKVKPVHTVELVVLGAEWGHGRRTGTLSNLHLGALDPDTGEFVMVGKTFKGLTDDLLRWQTQTFLELKEGESDNGHTVFVRPEVVVEIAIDGVQRSTRYPGGVALRFARVKRYRPDRSADTAESIDELRARLS